MTISLFEICYIMTNEQDPNGLPQHAPGAKLDAGKMRPALVLGGFARALIEVCKVGTYGAVKYTPGGWTFVDNGVERYDDAGLRHWLIEKAGQDADADTDLLHASHQAWNALARLDLMLRKREETPAPEIQLERDKAPAECDVRAVDHASDPLPVTCTLIHPQFGQLVIHSPWQGWGGTPLGGYRSNKPMPSGYPPDMGVKISTAGGVIVRSTFGDCKWDWQGGATDIVAFMPIHAASKPKTFMFKSVELRSAPGRTCEGCAVPGIGNCNPANDAARQAEVISSPGGCGRHGLIYVRA